MKKASFCLINPIYIPWIILGIIWIGWQLSPFFHVGMLTNDQQIFSLTDPSDALSKAIDGAKNQGRIYFVLIKFLDILMASKPETLIAQLLAVGSFSLAPICISVVVFTKSIQRFLFTFLYFCLAWSSFDHVPPAAYPLVNHIAFPALAAIAILLRSKHSTNRQIVALPMFALLCFFSIIQYEPVTLISLLLISWSLYTSKIETKIKNKYVAILLLCTVAYAISFIIWSKIYPTSYDGAMPGSFNIGTVSKVIFAYSIGALPFLSPSSQYIPLRWHSGPGERFNFIVDTSKYTDISFNTFAMAAIGLALFIWIALRLSKVNKDLHTEEIEDNRLGLKLALLAVALIIAPNLLLGFSAKYQIWVTHYVETYLTSQLSLYGWCLLPIPLFQWISKNINFRSLPIGLIGIATGINAISIPIHHHNSQNAITQRASLSRWEALDAIASAKDAFDANNIIAPQFFFFAFGQYPNPSAYWKRYTKIRYDLAWDFASSVSSSTSQDNSALLSFSLAENGEFNFATIQTKSKTIVLSKGDKLPLGIVSRTNRKGMPLDWKLASTTRNGLYRLLTIDNDPAFIGVLNDLELFRTLPYLNEYLTQKLISPNQQQQWLRESFDLIPNTAVGIETSGLYGMEGDNNGSFRWSNGNANFKIPKELARGSVSLSIRIQSTGPNGTELKVTQNNTTIFNENISRSESNIEIDLLDLNPNDEELSITIQSSTWIPAEQNPKSNDHRKLGVQLSHVILNF